MIILNKGGNTMFFGPFLPIVPVMILLEYLPESIGGPIQEFFTDSCYQMLEAISELMGIAF